jgi:hypothetical protein
MPSMLDDADLDARWRVGLDAAADPGRWVEVESRVARRVVVRQRRQRLVAAAAALVVVVGLVAAGSVFVGGSQDRDVRTAGGAPQIVAAPTGPYPAATATFDPAAPAAQSITARRFTLELSVAVPGHWVLTVDENPQIRLESTNLQAPGSDGESGSSMGVEAAPGVYGITLTGADAGGATRTLHTTLAVAQEPAGAPVATVAVSSEPTLTLALSPDVVPAGVVAIEYVSHGGTHELTIDGRPGFALLSAAAPASGKVELAPGTYRLACAIPGHDEAGEHATLTVVAP